MRKIPKPKYKIGQVLVGHCHPHSSDTIMFVVEDASYNGKYGKWTYRGIHESKSCVMWEYDVDYQL